jgi:hypothetical protein
MPDLRRNLLGAIALLLTLVLWGCGDDPCNADADCDGGQFCQSGDCVTLCDRNEDCTNGRICERGICAVPQRCGDSGDCSFGSVCEEGICIEQPVECFSASDCPPNFRCCEGACYQPGTAAPACDGCESDRDCTNGYFCDESGVCQDESDVADDAEPDTRPDTPEDVAPDTAPDVEPDTAADTEPDTQPDTQPDAGPDVEPDAVPDAEPDTVPDAEPDAVDECEGRDDGQLGERCTARDDCCNGLCFGNPDAGRGVCTDTCDSYRACNPVGGGGDELFCYRELALDEPLCALTDYLDTCRGSSDCVDGRCLVSTRGNGCSYRCATTADCPSGSACGAVAFSDDASEFSEFVCVPIGATPCSGPSDCLSGTCLMDDETFESFCSTICNPTDPNACPSPFACTELPDGAGGTLPVCTLP